MLVYRMALEARTVVDSVYVRLRIIESTDCACSSFVPHARHGFTTNDRVEDNSVHLLLATT